MNDRQPEDLLATTRSLEYQPRSAPENPASALNSDEETERTRTRYDRIAPIYDQFEALAERLRIRHWRSKLWERVAGPEVLELGVGTGKNLAYYPDDVRVTAIDLSPAMLARARQRAQRKHLAVELLLADAQALPFADGSFDTVIASFVFCSVPDPVRGLQEVKRALTPGGQLLLLEHVLSGNRLLRPLMRLMNPVMVRLTGANFDRETLKNVEAAGFELHSVENLWGDVVKLIEARPRAIEQGAGGFPVS